MISNDREYKLTKAAIASFERAINEFDLFGMVKAGIDPVLARAQLASYERQVKELTRQLQGYEALKAGVDRQFPLTTVRQIGERLIAARVAKGWTQRQLAEELGLKEQQVQRYERERYENTSLKRLGLIASALGLEIAGSLLLSSEPDGSTVKSEAHLWHALNPSLFPVREMNSRGWFGERLDMNGLKDSHQRRALYSFLMDSGYDVGRVALHRRTGRPADPKTASSLVAWQARILSIAKRQRDDTPPYEGITAEFVQNLVSLSLQPDGPVLAVEALRRHGIVVVLEPHLPGTLLDGAAMALNTRHAVIGMSLRHNRLDNFWFVLLHEVGHIAKHWGPMLRSGFIDEDITDLSSSFEIEADEFAQNAIISEALWKSSFVRYTQSKQEVLDFATRHNVSAALVAGRIRRERKDYKVFTDLVGHGKVRALFQKAGLYSGE